MKSACKKLNLVDEVVVVIITRNRVDELLRTLNKMTALPEKPHIVVVDNNSSDNTRAAVAEKFASVKVIFLKKNAGAAARTIGARSVNSKYIAFCDDDCWWESGALTHAASILEQNSNLALISGKVLIGHEEREDPACTEMEQSALKSIDGMPGRPILGFLAGATMVRRSAFLRTGGFTSAFMLGGEEELVAIDLAVGGWYMAYVKEVIVHHYPSPKRETSLRRKTLIRNKLWVTWLRRPLPYALKYTARLLFFGFAEFVVWDGFFKAIRRLHWVVYNRKVIPRHLEMELRKLET